MEAVSGGEGDRERGGGALPFSILGGGWRGLGGGSPILTSGVNSPIKKKKEKGKKEKEKEEKEKEEKITF